MGRLCYAPASQKEFIGKLVTFNEHRFPILKPSHVRVCVCVYITVNDKHAITHKKHEHDVCMNISHKKFTLTLSAK